MTARRRSPRPISSTDRVVPFYDASEVRRLCRVLDSIACTEYCGNPEHHEYELYLALEDIDHSRTKTKSPQTNGIVERFHKTRCSMYEFYRVVFRKKIYRSIAELQADLDAWVQSYNEDRAHQGRWCFGKTPMQTFLDATPLAKEGENELQPDHTWTGRPDPSPDADRQIKCQLLHRSDALDLVAWQIVQDDDVAGLELGKEELLDPGAELLAVDRPVGSAQGATRPSATAARR